MSVGSVEHKESLLSDQDLYLFNEGTHRHLGERLARTSGP